ncbi:MAG TPA: SDR family oxidoreductase [Verrucomicrobiales bacterium]|jgi:3-oxoacyl-[acyl-carrier protein] reductase|nr:SDR family oxidoreductase [Verrucomicrobiales bacterium]
MNLRLDGRTALVTGATRGLGVAMARALGKAGAKVAVNYANSDTVAAAALESLLADGCDVQLFKADVTDPAQTLDLVSRVRASLGPVDVLVVNATPDQPHCPVEEYDWAFCQQMLDFFVKSPFLLTQAVLPDMKERRHGRIINITSEVFVEGTPNFCAYVAAKGGQEGLTRSLSRELAPWGITVNSVAPGWVPVERHAQDPKAAKDAYLATIPAGRWGTPDDVAAAVAFLASNEAAFISGQSLGVNGARTL